MTQYTPKQIANARKVARAFVDILDRDYAMMYLDRRIHGYRVPRIRYQGIGSAERIEAAIDEALTA